MRKARVTKKSTAIAKRPSLAAPDDPYVLADGKKIKEHGIKREVPKVPAGEVTPENFRPTSRKSIAELPAPVGTMKAVGVVFALTMMGLGDTEICQMLGVKPQDIKDVRSHNAYAETFETIRNEFISANSVMLSSRIAAMQHAALDNVVDLSMNAEKEDVRFKASADILDRGGNRAVDIAAKKTGNVMNELRITIVKQSDADKVQMAFGEETIDLEEV